MNNLTQHHLSPKQIIIELEEFIEWYIATENRIPLCMEEAKNYIIENEHKKERRKNAKKKKDNINEN